MRSTVNHLTEHLLPMSPVYTQERGLGGEFLNRSLGEDLTPTPLLAGEGIRAFY